MPELVFLLADGEPGGAAFDDERRDAAVAGLGIHGREHEEHVRFVAVGDPQLAAGDDVGVAVLTRSRRQREGVAAGARFRQRVRADGVGGQLREIAPLDVVVAPAQERVDDERVLHVDEDADGRVDPRQLLDGEHGVKEARAGAAVRLGDFDAP